jgi:hypothetical protein
LLDFPTREKFAKELTENQYDIVGISSITVNVGKVRELSPGSTILVGGHVAAIPEINDMVDADHIVRGDGIAWMRGFLGEDVHAPVRRPHIVSGFDRARWALKFRLRPDTLLPRSSPPWAARWDATSVPRRRSSAVRGSFSTSTKPAASYLM